MPNLRFDWHEHVNSTANEFQATRLAVDRFRAQILQTPDILSAVQTNLKHLRQASENLEGTFLVRLFAAFEAALRSFDRARHRDPNRIQDAAVLIDVTAGRRSQGIPSAVREGAHAVRRVRNYWAHEADELPEPLTLAEARARLQKYLSFLPEKWD